MNPVWGSKFENIKDDISAPGKNGISRVMSINRTGTEALRVSNNYRSRM